MMREPLLRRRGSRRALTMIEMIFVVALSVPVVAVILSAMMFITRTQATAANMALVRMEAEGAVKQLAQDVRFTSRGVYNDTSPSVRLVNGTVGNEMTLQLFDMVNGNIIYWRYNRVSGRLSRQVGRIVEGKYVMGEQRLMARSLSDLTVQEVETQEMAGSQVVTVVTGLRIRGRALMSMNPLYTMLSEVDGDENGDLRDDEVGEAFFGRTDRGDDPRWQYVVNMPISFRNS